MIIELLRSSKTLTIIFIYLGTLCYVTASYFHLSLQEWTFLKALAIALPIVLIEYQFSLRANRIANQYHNFNPLQILLITLCFYFTNTWLLNFFIIKNPINYQRELIAFALIITAFFITTRL